MRRLTAFLLTAFIPCLTASAQNGKEVKLDGKATVNARIIDGSSAETMTSVAIQMFRLPDSTFVHGTITGNDGWFTIKKVPVGEYMLRFSFLGYNTQEHNVKIVKEDRERALGVFRMTETGYQLSEAVIQETLPPTQVVEDTMMFNTDAYRVPEGSVLEELIKRLPGVEIDENGGITVNGKTVTRFLVDGEEYFGNDLSMASKNLPVSIIHRIKTYQRKSDLARVTGVDDGEEETVMDLQIKPKMKRGWLNNLDAGIGEPVGNNYYSDWLNNLYSGRYTLNRFSNSEQLSFTANTQNSGRNNGVSENTQFGVNFSKNIGEKYPRRRNEYPLQLNGNVRWNGSSTRSLSESESETFTTEYTQSSFRNNRSDSRNGNSGINGEMKVEWRPDTTIDIIFRPRFSVSRNHSSSGNESATFNVDPYSAGMTDILEQYRMLDQELLDSIGVNSQSSTSYNKGGSNQINTEFQFNKKLREDGRNLTLRFTWQKNSGTNESFSHSRQEYYQMHSRDSIMNRYNVNPTDNSNWSGRIMWSEPFDSGRRNIQISYQIQASRRETNRETYVMPSRGEFENWEDDWYLPYEIGQYLNSELSRKATNVTRNHTITLQYRHNTDHTNFNLGVNFMPQYTGMDNFQYMGHTIGDTSRVVYNWSPSLNWRYRWNNRKNIQFTLRSNTSQPSMEDMLDITDDSNPLNIRKGNPGLLPSLRNTFETNLQLYFDSTQQTLNVRLSVENSLRNISQRTDYDPMTGISVTQPRNMEGFWTNWSTSGNVTFNQTIPNTKWRYSTSANLSFRHQESFARTGSIGNYNERAGDGSAVLATARTITAGQNASVTYRTNDVEMSANGRINFNHSENNIRQNGNMETYNFSYGLRGNYRLPWKNINLGTDITMQSRRGYSGSYNRDDLIWNANASISFFPANAGTLQFQYFDILNDESNVNRNVTATSRTDTRNNSVHSYFMVHLILKVNVFGDRETRREIIRNYFSQQRQERQQRQSNRAD